MDGLTPREKEVRDQILQRDRRDTETAERAEATFVVAGMTPAKHGRLYVLNTDDSPGPEHNAEQIRSFIISEIPEVRIITVEGVSGSGKSDTAVALAHALPGCMVSLGELFRYLTWCTINQQEKGPFAALTSLRLVQSGGHTELWRDEDNISQRLAAELRDPNLESVLPEVAEDIQVPAIKFAAEQLYRLRKESDRPLIIEGRGYHLHYLPADLRIRLEVNADVRARRRAAQQTANPV